MESASLADLQRRLAAWIRDPEAGPGPGKSRGADAPPADLLQGDARASADVRLAIYASAYQTRIREALGRDHPGLTEALGGDGFHDLVLLYLLAFPPEQPSLRLAGARLAGFLADHPAAAAFRRRWPFSADLARLEWALVDAFDAPDAQQMTTEDLQKVPAVAFESLQLFFHPSVIRLSLEWPVHRLLTADGKVAGTGPPIRPEPSELLIWRRREEPRFRALAADEAGALDEARRGAPFGALCELLAGGLGPEAAPARAAALLATWARDGLLRRPA